VQLPPAEFSPTALLVPLPFETQTIRPPDTLFGSCAESCAVVELLTTGSLVGAPLVASHTSEPAAKFTPSRLMTSPGSAPVEALKIRGAVALALAVGTTRFPPEEVPPLPEELLLDVLPLEEPLVDEPLLDVLPLDVLLLLDVAPLEAPLPTEFPPLDDATPVVPVVPGVASGEDPLLPLQAARAASVGASRQRRKVLVEITGVLGRDADQ
jgi:hypothetical protein